MRRPQVKPQPYRGPSYPWGPYRYVGGGQIVGSDDQPIAHLVTSGTAEVRLHSHNIDEIGNGMAAWRELYGALSRAHDLLIRLRIEFPNNEAVREIADEAAAALAKARGDADKISGETRTS